MRAVRVLIKADGSSNYTKIYEGIPTNWNDETGEGSVFVEHHEFNQSKNYFWKLAVQYDYRGGVIWSQYSADRSLDSSGAMELDLYFLPSFSLSLSVRPFVPTNVLPSL